MPPVVNVPDVFFCQLIAVGHFYELLRRIYEEHLIVRLGFFQHHNTGGNGCAIEKVGWQLDDTVYVVIIDKVLPDFPFCSAAVHDAREADDGCRAISGQPGQ